MVYYDDFCPNLNPCSTLQLHWMRREHAHHVPVLVLKDEDALSHSVDPSSTGSSDHLLVLAPLQEVRGHVRRAQNDSGFEDVEVKTQTLNQRSFRLSQGWGGF